MDNKKRLRKKVLFISGKTEDDKLIVGGFFKLVDGQGIHLADILFYFNKNDLIPDWLGFIQDTKSHNWKFSSVLERIQHACLDIYGKTHTDIVMKKILHQTTHMKRN